MVDKSSVAEQELRRRERSTEGGWEEEEGTAQQKGLTQKRNKSYQKYQAIKSGPVPGDTAW